MHYLYHDVIERARRVQMTDAERLEQLVSHVYGTVHLEYPQITRELVRHRLEVRIQAGAEHGALR